MRKNFQVIISEESVFPGDKPSSAAGLMALLNEFFDDFHEPLKAISAKEIEVPSCLPCQGSGIDPDTNQACRACDGEGRE